MECARLPPARRYRAATVSERLPPLAPGTEVGAALGHHYPADERAAFQAGLPRAAVGAVLDLEPARAPFGVDVVGNGRAARGDGLAQHLAHRVEEAARAWPAQAPGDRHGVDAGAEQRLVGVDV